MKKLYLVIIVILLAVACTKEPKELTAYDNKTVEELPVAYLVGYRNMELTNDYFKRGTLELLDSLYIEGKPFVFYMGFAGCPYCQDLAPVLLEAATEYNVPVVYIDVDEEWDNFEAEIGETIKNTYYDELDRDEQGVKQFYFPFVVFVKDQKVLLSNIGTVDSHDAHERSLNEKEAKRLKAYLGKGFRRLLAK